MIRIQKQFYQPDRIAFFSQFVKYNETTPTNIFFGKSIIKLQF